MQPDRGGDDNVTMIMGMFLWRIGDDNKGNGSGEGQDNDYDDDTVSKALLKKAWPTCSLHRD